MAVSCARCEGPVDLHDSYVIGYAKQSAMEWIYLCDHCKSALREWMATRTREGASSNEQPYGDRARRLPAARSFGSAVVGLEASEP